MFSNSLGRRLLRYDTCGHGMSSTAPRTTLAQLGGDLLRLLDALEIDNVDVCGILMGGLTGLWLGIRAGHRLRRLVVANSTACIGTAEG